MELSAALFEGITGLRLSDPADAGAAPADAAASIPASIEAADTPNAERRKYKRFVFGSRAAISPLRLGLDKIDSTAIIRDISMAGISLLYPDPLEIGDEVVIQFSGEHGWPARILCIVRRCEPGGEECASYVIGATFETLIDACDDNMAAGEIGMVPDGTFAASQKAKANPTPEPAPAAPALIEPPAPKNIWQAMKLRLMNLCSAT